MPRFTHMELLSPDINGKLRPSNMGDPAWLATVRPTEPTYSGRIQGNAAPGGTKILSFTVAPGKAFYITGYRLRNTVAGFPAVQAKVVSSDSITPGAGAETELNVMDIEAGNSEDSSRTQLVCMFRNTTTTAKYVLIYLPAARWGVPGNNAVTQFVILDLMAMIE